MGIVGSIWELGTFISLDEKLCPAFLCFHHHPFVNMAAFALTTTTTLTASSLARASKNREVSSSSSSSLHFSSCSSLSPRFPSLSLYAHQRTHGKGRVLVACVSSSPNTSTVPPNSTKLYVSGLSFRTTEESLKNAFQNFGQLVEVNLVMDRIANRPRGFAFLRYATEEESKKAIEGMHGKFLDGRVIFVEVAKPRSELRQNLKRTPGRY
ncbi:hypothetical protein Syun_022503 [Stephania yunnanensis]|uniref:RRM domain-containing protein n=1 Tax=Stephania yunnanensis TaxID=152371 RepID=A0AAP0F9R7_9MAGN